MKLKIEYKTIADRVRGKIVSRRPTNHVLSDKETRFLSESIVKEFGGLKVYSAQDEYGSEYNILGVEDYVFYDRSIIRLDGARSYTIDAFMHGESHASFFGLSHYKEKTLVQLVQQNIGTQLGRIKGLRLIQLKIKCQTQLPIGEPY